MIQMDTSWTIWETDFHCDNFLNQLNPDDSLYSINDSIPTNCSYGRKKRREEMTIPRLPKSLIRTQRIGSGIGRGITNSSMRTTTKPGHSNSLDSMRPMTRPGNLCNNTSSRKPENMATPKQKTESIIFDQNSIHNINVCYNRADSRSSYDSQMINLHNEEEFPELTSSNTDLKSNQRIRISKRRK
ncbi:uncharacterized protein LOC115232654 [Argonauta hians]